MSKIILRYEAGKNLIGMPYDWRKSANENEEVLAAMKSWTEKMFYENGNQTVFLISHSMGGLMTKAFLESWVFAK